MRAHWETQHGGCQFFGSRETVLYAAVLCISPGKVRRYRVMDKGADTGIRQPLLQLISKRMPNYKKVPHRLRPSGHERQGKIGNIQERIQVEFCEDFPPSVPFIQPDSLTRRKAACSSSSLELNPL